MSEVVAIVTPVTRSPLTYVVGMAMHTYTMEARDRGISVVWVHTKHYGVAEARERGVEIEGDVRRGTSLKKYIFSRFNPLVELANKVDEASFISQVIEMYRRARGTS